MRMLDFFNFGSDIKNWVKIFYMNIESAVQNNGLQPIGLNRQKECD